MLHHSREQNQTSFGIFRGSIFPYHLRLIELVKSPWSTERRGISPPFLTSFHKGDNAMSDRILSIFIDESGDLGPYDRQTSLTVSL